MKSMSLEQQTLFFQDHKYNLSFNVIYHPFEHSIPKKLSFFYSKNTYENIGLKGLIPIFAYFKISRNILGRYNLIGVYSYFQKITFLWMGQYQVVIYR